MPALLRNAPGLDLDEVRRELDVPESFPTDVLAEAERAAGAPRLPDADATDLPFVTIDPPDSRDLDQAVHLAARGSGYRVSYAIADVAAFVTAGSALDAECWRRGLTLYAPDKRTPLHPEALSEGAASLLPGEIRPAVLWEIDLDADGQVERVDVRRARVRSVAKLNYAGVQADLDAGRPHESIALLPDIGSRRQALARARHSIELNLPEQEVVAAEGGGWTLASRVQLPCEQWNAEVSLLTGMSAAEIMLTAGIGVLRTLPPARPGAVDELRTIAAALGVDWPDGAAPGDVISTVDPAKPKHAAFLEQAAHLLRGAGYAGFDGAAPDRPGHAAVAANYAHVTAPLRRLVDRFGSEVCVAVSAGHEVPDWAREALPRLPKAMEQANSRESTLERAVVDGVEAVLLSERAGQSFDAVVVDTGNEHARIVLEDPPVRARCETKGLRLGDRIRVRLEKADVATRQVSFVLDPDT